MNREKFCLLLSLGLLYGALPVLTLNGSGPSAFFSWIWLLLLFLHIGGNLAALIFPEKQGKKEIEEPSGKRVRVRG